VESNGELNDAADYRSLVVAYRQGAPVKLGDLAKVVDSVENDRLASWYNGKRSIVLAVQRQPGSNTVAVVTMIFSAVILAVTVYLFMIIPKGFIPNTVASVTKTLGPLNVSHLGQLSAVTISFNLSPGASIREATTRVQNIAQSTLPSSINSSFQGSAQVFQSSLGNLGFLLVIAILVIYLVLGILYEDFIHPVTILSSLPLVVSYFFNFSLFISPLFFIFTWNP